MATPLVLRSLRAWSPWLVIAFVDGDGEDAMDRPRQSSQFPRYDSILSTEVGSAGYSLVLLVIQTHFSSFFENGDNGNQENGPYGAHPHQFHSHTATLLQIADHQAMIQDDMSNRGREGLTSNVNDRPLLRWQERAGFERRLDLRQTIHKPVAVDHAQIDNSLPS
jgi:hypothetical protein